MIAKKQPKQNETTIEWDRAREAANKLGQMLTDEVSYLIDGNKVQNMYSAMAWVHLSRSISTLTAGMICIRLAFQGKSNREIEKATGISSSSIGAYKAWNTMYARHVEKMLAVKGKTPKERKLKFLLSNWVTF